MRKRITMSSVGGVLVGLICVGFVGSSYAAVDAEGNSASTLAEPNKVLAAEPGLYVVADDAVQEVAAVVKEAVAEAPGQPLFQELYAVQQLQLPQAFLPQLFIGFSGASPE